MALNEWVKLKTKFELELLVHGWFASSLVIHLSIDSPVRKYVFIENMLMTYRRHQNRR